MDRRHERRVGLRRGHARHKGNEVTRTSILFIAAIAIAAASCAPAPAPAVAPAAPQGNDRFLIDPRTGYDAPPAPANAKRFDDAWRAILAGDYTTARKKLDDIHAKEPGYAPVQLAEAAIDLRQGKTDAARPIVERVLSKRPRYTAAEVYAAEIAIAEKRTREAYDVYRVLASHPGAPSFADERIAELRTTLFDQLYNASLAAPDDEAIRLLRDALSINPTASAARVLLVQKLVGQHKYDEARTELEPILS